MRHFYFFGDRRHFSYRLFRHWHNTLRQYERTWGTDCLAYVYNQQPNVGLLAIAAYRMEGLPFVDFSIQKRGPGGRKYQGRCDLSIFLKKGKEVFIEAERITVGFQDEADVLKTKLAKPLKKATNAVNRIIPKYYLAIGIVFIIPKKVAKSDFDPNGFIDCLDEARKKLNADICAVHFGKHEIWSQVPNNDCPGIAVVGKSMKL